MQHRKKVLALVISSALYAANANAQLVITEVMSNSGQTADWFELTNTGTTPVNISGYRMDDNSFNFSASVALLGITEIAPNESVIFIEGSGTQVSTFQTVWGSKFSNLKIGTYSGSGVGLAASGDGVVIYNTSGIEQTRQSFGAATTGISFRWNTNDSPATPSAVDDSHGSKSVTNGSNTDIASPGQIAPPPVASPPTVSGITNLQTLSGVAGDSTDFYANQGLTFTVADSSVPAGSLTVTATSSNPAIATVSSPVNNNGTVNFRITPVSKGFADINVTVSNGTNSTTLTLKYAASDSTTAGSNTRWPSGRSDLSTIVRVDANTALAADDEPSNVLLAYDTNRSGPPLKRIELTAAQLGTNAGSGCERISSANCNGESDLEAAAKIGNRIYWLGSHSHNSSGAIRPDRWRVFATDVSGTGSNVSTTLTGYYKHLIEDLAVWDFVNTHGLGSNYLGLDASRVRGVIPESPNLDGFSMEGLTFAPDNTTAWLGFRAPLVSAPGQPAVTAGSSTGRTHALIVPVTNMNALVTSSNGGTVGTATFGAPIRLDLGGRGIREIQRAADGKYWIIAGPPDAATNIAPKDFRLYVWDGSVTANGEAKNLILMSTDLTTMRGGMNASPEGLLDLPNSHLNSNAEIKILSDAGDVAFYNPPSTTIAKDLPEGHRKGRLDTVTVGAAQACYTGTAPNVTRTSPTFNIPANRWIMFGLPLDPGSNNQVQQIFSALDASKYNTRWVVYEVNNATMKYVKLNLTSPMSVGKAYWIINLDGATNITMNGTPASVDAYCQYGLPLHANAAKNGENAIANPFAGSIDWNSLLVKSGSNYYTPAQADSANLFSASFKRTPSGSGAAGSAYNYTTPQTNGSIAPWEAIWVQTKSSFTSGTILSITNP